MTTGKRGHPSAPAVRRDGRESILCATREIVAEVGYQNATVEEIRRRAGVARATFYAYFRSKQQAFIAAMDTVIDELYTVAGLRSPNPDEYGRIVEGNANYLRAWARHRRVLAEWYALALIDPEAREIYEANRQRFEDRIHNRLCRLMERGRIPSTDPRLLTSALMGMIETFVRRHLGADATEADCHEIFPRAVEVVSECWYRMVYAKPAPAYPYDELRYAG
ncbi:MAG: hypothetical protein Kow0010_08100 [Dehalococcoidia bacterium]